MNDSEKKFFESILNCKISSKKEVNTLLRKKYDNNFSLTNINQLNFTQGEYNFSYNYQRFDSNLSYDDFEHNFYNLTEINSKTIFTNCGMSSIFAVLFNFSKIGKYIIDYDNDIYFETQKLIRILNFNFGKKITYMDTISDRFEFEYNKKNSIIIIDTTCYHPYKFKKFINHLVDNNNFVILVRSHIKLDMLGLEYSFLGSITFFLPKKVSIKRFNFIKNFIQNTINFCGNTGIIAMEKSIFPLLSNKKLITLNEERIKRINNNNLYFYNKYKKYKDITLYKHNLFSTVIINSSDLNKTIEFLKNESKKTNQLFYYSGSFGLDYIAVDTYFDMINKKNAIRISIGDVDVETINKFINYLKDVDYDKI